MEASVLKRCPRCREEKATPEFYLRKGKPDGWCRDCMSGYYRDQRLNNPEATARKDAHTAAWREKNPKKIRVYDRANHLKSEYGLTLDQYDEMLAAQNGRCAICDREAPPRKDGKTPFLVVDHNHDTGAVRMLLCIRCNSHLSWFEKFRDKITTYPI